MNYFKHEQALVHPEAKIGDGTRIWAFTNVQHNASIGQNCNICDGCFVESGVVIGDEVTVKNHVSVFEGVTLENHVFVGSNVSIINDRHPRSFPNHQWTLERILVRQGATLGAGVVILCGVTIGRYALIGAGSVVTKDVPDYGLVCGNPSRIIGYVCRCGQKLNNEYVCVCGQCYQMSDQGLTLNE